MLEKLGHHPNIIGVKLTCGGIAKVARIRSRFEPEQFCALAGQSDWLLPAIAIGGIGTITGLANIYPRVSISPFPVFFPSRSLNLAFSSRHASNCTTSPSAAEPKKQRKPKLNLPPLNGALPREESMARSGLLPSIWGIRRLAATQGDRILGTVVRRSRRGFWIS